MLDITIDLNPFGSGENIKRLARIRIANVSREVEGPPSIYVYKIQEPPSMYCKEGVECMGMITGYNRMNPAVALLNEVLEDSYRECRAPIPDWLQKKLEEIWT